MILICLRSGIIDYRLFGLHVDKEKVELSFSICEPSKFDGPFKREH